MADFFGGRIPVVGVNPFNTGNSGVPGVLPQANFGTRNLNNVVGVGLNPDLGNAVSLESGFNLSNGSDFLASQVNSSLSPNTRNQLTQTVSSTLSSLGPASNLFSLTQGRGSQGVTSLASGFSGVTNPNFGGPSTLFPGAGGLGSVAANFAAAAAYTLGVGGPDVVMSIQPANQGPQLFGQQALADPTSPTTQAFSQFSSGGLPNYAGANFDVAGQEKLAAMDPGFSTVAGSEFSRGFGTSSTLGANFTGGLAAGASAPVPGYTAAAGTTEGLSSLGSTQDYFSYWKPETATAFENAEFSSPVTQSQENQSGAGQSWTFIVAPEDISWDSSNEVSRVAIFGTNNPPVVSGTRGKRDLSLSNALVEGFTRNSTVEDKIIALENLMNYSLNTQAGFVNVPVYQVWANDKKFGNNAYFVIQSVSAKETMRDLSGQSTRAYVDVKLMQVPAYQVDSGRDQASVAQTGAKAQTPAATAAGQTPAQASAAQANATANQGVPAAPKPQAATAPRTTG